MRCLEERWWTYSGPCVGIDIWKYRYQISQGLKFGTKKTKIPLHHIKPSYQLTINKANLRDLIAATGLVILLKLDSNRRFFARVTLKFDGWPRKVIRHVCLLYHIKLCVSFQIHQWIQTGVTVRKRPIWVKIDDFLALWSCNLTYDLEKQ